jgi:hypothetical protein
MFRGYAMSSSELGTSNFGATFLSRFPFVIEVVDPLDRFLSCTFDAELPTSGLFNSVKSPPRFAIGPAISGVPLFSAPARSVPANMAVVRADLIDIQTQKPAKWAVLEVRIDEQPPAWGLADDQGRVVVILPYPTPLDSYVSSPLGSPPGFRRPEPWRDRKWTAEVQVFYTRRQTETRIAHLNFVLNQAPAEVLVFVPPRIG